MTDIENNKPKLTFSEIFSKNKNKVWSEWLEFDKTFEKPGKQGIVGLLKSKETGDNCVFKISQYINYLVQHEYKVMEGLNSLSNYCPHFCKSIGYIECDIDSKSRKTGNPFEINTKYPILKEVLLTEYIDNSYKMYNYIRSDKVPEKNLYSIVKQVLMGITIAQKKKKFSHYDLHSFNIMMKKCDKDLVFVYVIDKDNQFAIPTHGNYPVIIDFGFSYISDMDDGPLWASMAHTDVGFMSDRFDWVADPKLFLVTVSKEINNKRNSKTSKKFRRIVKNIFNHLTIDLESGWDKHTEKGSLDYVCEILEIYNDKSELFDKYENYCIDLIQSLIILPLEKQDYSNIDKSYKAFLQEWVKIENEISNPFYNLYILKGVVDSARYVRSSYLSKDNRLESIIQFQRMIFEKIEKVTKFCMPKKIHFEKLLCSILILSKNIEGILFDVVKTRMKQKKSEYNKMPLKSIEQIYGAIEANMSDNYVYSKDTKVMIFDSLQENTSLLTLTDNQIKLINKIHPLCRGSTLFDIHTGKSPI